MAATTASAPYVMLHLGLGSFHRAHQAVYLHRLQTSGDRRWSLAGGNLRPDMAETIAALVAQRGAYTLETVTPAGARSYERIGSIGTVVPYEPGLAPLIAIGVAPATRIVSFTVTEGGYCLDAKGALDPAVPELVADIEAARRGECGTTLYGALTALLRARMRRGAGPLTLLNCDNLRHNGERLRAALLRFVELAGDAALFDWIQAHTSCPNGMVDRITPRPTADLRERVRAATGRDDAAPVMGESFIQWVIEDQFIAGRPAWESVGVEMVESVAPYEEAKIRILNASHSCIAWAGSLVGLQFIHEGTQHAGIRGFAHDYVTDDVIPCLEPSPIDLAKYRDVVLERFVNPALRDTNQRVAMDGFSKLPGFIVPTIRERLAAGASIAKVAMPPALFLAFLQRWHRGELPFAYQDTAMDADAAHAICEAGDPLAAFCADAVLWGSLAGDERVVAALRDADRRVEAFVQRWRDPHPSPLPHAGEGAMQR